MDVYNQAAEIIKLVREGHGTAKSLCLRKEMQKKRQTFAVVSETLRHFDLLQAVLKKAEFFEYYPKSNFFLAMCMAYDSLLGMGVHTKQHSTAIAIVNSLSYLMSAFELLKNEPGNDAVNSSIDEKQDDLEGKNSSAPSYSKSIDDRNALKKEVPVFPRYARVNTLVIDTPTLVSRLRSTKKSSIEKGLSHLLPDFHEDSLIPDVLVFPPGTLLYNHPSCRRGQLVLQDRASCIPACVLLNAVEVLCEAETDAENSTDLKLNKQSFQYVLDACAAPGNKTAHLAALGASKDIKILAIERDSKRTSLLQRRIQQLHAESFVNVMNMDFFDLSQLDRDAVEAILLDPSCSASGMVQRIDVSLGLHADDIDSFANETEGRNKRLKVESSQLTLNESSTEEKISTRVQRLSDIQKKMLRHALLSFPNCHRVVYSTCSVHDEENEEVIESCLLDPRVIERKWKLSHIMPSQWSNRGRFSKKKSLENLPIHYTIRCDPTKDLTSGFFVACLDRY